MKKLHFALMSLGLILTSCGGENTKEEDRAEELCSCIEELDVDFNLRSLENLYELKDVLKGVKRSERSDIAKCLTTVLRDIKSDMKGENDKDKSEYLKKLSKSFNDTDCGNLKESKDIDLERFHADLKELIRIMESNIDIGDRAYDDY
jgi:hypothetical protein